MSNKHEERYITKLLSGFALVTGGIMVILYGAFERAKEGDWYFWGIVSAVLINAGLWFLLSAFIHKIKSDFIRKQRMREQQKSFTTD